MFTCFNCLLKSVCNLCVFAEIVCLGITIYGLRWGIFVLLLKFRSSAIHLVDVEGKMSFKNETNVYQSLWKVHLSILSITAIPHAYHNDVTIIQINT